MYLESVLHVLQPTNEESFENVESAMSITVTCKTALLAFEVACTAHVLLVSALCARFTCVCFVDQEDSRLSQ